MGLRPTRGNENPARHPREARPPRRRGSGGPYSEELDSRLRGNDVTFGRAARRLPACGLMAPLSAGS